VIHGYGSSGPGGAIQQELRRYLAVNSDRLEMYIEGDSVGNHGITKVHPKRLLPVIHDSIGAQSSRVREAILGFCDTPKASNHPPALGTTITITATATNSIGTSIGPVTFYTGATPLGKGTLSCGVATPRTSHLTVKPSVSVALDNRPKVGFKVASLFSPILRISI
jgi:hypothetical protein